MDNKKDIYKLLADAYDGTGGFLDGTYLRQHPREDNGKYSARRALAYYLNYLKPCVDAHVTPIFKTLAARDYTGVGADAWGQFVQDVDFTGTKLADLMKRAAQASKLFGTAFIVMDRAQGDEAAALTVQDLAEDRGKLPYAFLVEPLRVERIEADKFGRITKFVYLEADQEAEYKQAKRTLTPEGWELDSSKGKTSGKWDLGCVPVIPLQSKNCDASDPLPPSDFISIAKTSLAIYNMSSWLSDILINQTFSILVYPSNSTDDLVIGTSNALGFPPEATHMPGFVSPSPDPATILAANIERLQQECYRMAAVVNVTGVRVQASGTAKAWDFEQTNQILSDFADKVEAAELKLAELFKLWLGVEFDYKLSYPSDFSIADVETELANAEVAKGLSFGDEFNVEVFKRILTSYLPELPDDDFDRLVAAYEKQQEKEKLDMEQVLNNPPDPNKQAGPPGQGDE